MGASHSHRRRRGSSRLARARRGCCCASVLLDSHAWAAHDQSTYEASSGLLSMCTGSARSQGAVPQFLLQTLASYCVLLRVATSGGGEEQHTRRHLYHSAICAVLRSVGMLIDCLAA